MVEYIRCFAGIAQSVEQLIRNQQVACSSHVSSSKEAGPLWSGFPLFEKSPRFLKKAGPKTFLPREAARCIDLARRRAGEGFELTETFQFFFEKAGPKLSCPAPWDGLILTSVPRGRNVPITENLKTSHKAFCLFILTLNS